MLWLNDLLFWLPDAFQGQAMSLEQFFAAGGWVMQVIALLCLVLFSLLAERYWYRWRIYRQQKRWLQQQLSAMPVAGHSPAAKPLASNSLARSALTQGYQRRSLVCDLRLALDERLSLIRSLISLCPLLGLLGTVSGMIQVFEVLAVSGTGNPRLMAAGIASATLPTLAGMAVSVSGLLLYSYLKSWSDRQSQQLRLPLSGAGN